MSLFLPDLQKFFLQVTAEVVYWRCSLIKWIKSRYVTDGMVIEVWTRRDVKGRSHAARIGTDAVTHVAAALQTLVLCRAGMP